MGILFFLFAFKTAVFMLILPYILTFWYTIQHLGNKLGSSVIDQIGKTAFTTEFFTVANTLEVVGAIKLVATNVIMS